MARQKQEEDCGAKLVKKKKNSDEVAKAAAAIIVDAIECAFQQQKFDWMLAEW